MGTPYLWDNAVLDRHARIANGLPVETELEFAEALVLMASFPDGGVDADAELLDSFMDRKRALAGERGGIHLGVLLIVVGVVGGFWGWTHSSSAPNGATVLGVLIVTSTVSIIATFGHFYRRAERRAKVYTAEVEKRLRQDTTGAHYGDA